jgi:hypothetical protein
MESGTSVTMSIESENSFTAPSRVMNCTHTVRVEVDSVGSSNCQSMWVVAGMTRAREKSA